MKHPPNETREASLNSDVATRLANEALSFQLGTTTRTVMNSVTVRLVEQIETFFEEGLPEDKHEAARQRKEIQGLLDHGPAREDPTFSAWTYMRELGRVLRRHVMQYQERHAGQNREGQSEGGSGIEHEPTTGQPSGTYRVPSGLAVTRPRRWLSLAGGGAR